MFEEQNSTERFNSMSFYNWKWWRLPPKVDRTRVILPFESVDSYVDVSTVIQTSQILPFGFAIMDTVEREKARLATWLKTYCVLGAKEATVDDDAAIKAEASIVLTFIEIQHPHPHKFLL